MADDKTKTAEDRKLISLTEDYEVEYWSRKFGVTRERLTEAVRQVGHSVAAVEKHFRR